MAIPAIYADLQKEKSAVVPHALLTALVLVIIVVLTCVHYALHRLFCIPVQAEYGRKRRFPTVCHIRQTPNQSHSVALLCRLDYLQAHQAYIHIPYILTA